MKNLWQSGRGKGNVKRQYLVTERAHFMCPNMHFGILMEIEKEYRKVNTEETLNRMAEAHPFLKSLIAYEEGTDKLYYKITECSQITLAIKESISSLWLDYKKVSEQDWNVFENGLLKVYIYPQKQGMKLLFVAHHLLTDGRGLLDIAQEFANDYVGDIFPVYVEETLLESIRWKSGIFRQLFCMAEKTIYSHWKWWKILWRNLVAS